MDKRRIGSLDVSVVGLGCNNFGWRLDEAASARVVHAALDAGINFLDTADKYGGSQSEVFLGRALKGRRKEAVIATKFGLKLDEQRQGARPEYVRRALEDSLRRLDVEQVDLYQLHKPDPTVPIADTLGALNDLVRAGKVREIGCSNFSAEQLREAEGAVKPGAARFVSVQNEYSLLNREAERDAIPECLRAGLAFIPYFPLASGLLTGKYRKGQPLPKGTRIGDGAYGADAATERNLALVESLIRFAEARGHTLLELAFSWLAGRPAVSSIIAGATSPEQVRANAAAVGWRLSQGDLEELEGILARA
jgi:aryl-alcohol dehydrogenase-like predicted oxidoreductase